MLATSIGVSAAYICCTYKTNILTTNNNCFTEIRILVENVLSYFFTGKPVVQLQSTVIFLSDVSSDSRAQTQPIIIIVSPYRIALLVNRAPVCESYRVLLGMSYTRFHPFVTPFLGRPFVIVFTTVRFWRIMILGYVEEIMRKRFSNGRRGKKNVDLGQADVSQTFYSLEKGNVYCG